MTTKTTTKFGGTNHLSLKGHEQALNTSLFAKLSKERLDKEINYRLPSAPEEEERAEGSKSEIMRNQYRNSDSNLQMESGIIKGSG